MSERRFCQGDIWWYQPPPQEKVHGVLHGERPVIILSNNIFNKGSSVVNCIPMSRVDKRSPVHVFLKRIDMNQRKRQPEDLSLGSSYALCEQVMTVSQQFLIAHVGSVTYTEWDKIKQALQLQFCMA